MAFFLPYIEKSYFIIETHFKHHLFYKVLLCPYSLPLK